MTFDKMVVCPESGAVNWMIPRRWYFILRDYLYDCMEYDGEKWVMGVHQFATEADAKAWQAEVENEPFIAAPINMLIFAIQRMNGVLYAALTGCEPATAEGADPCEDCLENINFFEVMSQSMAIAAKRHRQFYDSISKEQSHE